jgi:putative Ca2+/H+ antiporter (TMEM165/GDT1 family)
VSVFFGATAALWSVVGLMVVLGNRAGRYFRPEMTKKVAAALFVVVGVALLLGSF